jgi:hypothetical protein
MMKARIMSVVLFLATMQFMALGLLFLLRLHYSCFWYLLSYVGCPTRFIAERYRRRTDTKELPNSGENSPAGSGGQ